MMTIIIISKEGYREGGRLDAPFVGQIKVNVIERLTNEIMHTSYIIPIKISKLRVMTVVNKE